MKENNLLISNERKKALRTNKEKPKPNPTKMNEWWGIDITGDPELMLRQAQYIQKALFLQ